MDLVMLVMVLVENYGDFMLPILVELVVLKALVVLGGVVMLVVLLFGFGGFFGGEIRRFLYCYYCCYLLHLYHYYCYS